MDQLIDSTRENAKNEGYREAVSDIEKTNAAK
jgi:hypothetical protein